MERDVANVFGPNALFTPASESLTRGWGEYELKVNSKAVAVPNTGNEDLLGCAPGGA